MKHYTITYQDEHPLRTEYIFLIKNEKEELKITRDQRNNKSKLEQETIKELHEVLKKVFG